MSLAAFWKPDHKSPYLTDNSLDRTLLTFKVFPDRFPDQLYVIDNLYSVIRCSNVLCCPLEVGGRKCDRYSTTKQNLCHTVPAVLYTSLHGLANVQNTLQILRISRTAPRIVPAKNGLILKHCPKMFLLQPMALTILLGSILYQAMQRQRIQTFRTLQSSFLTELSRLFIRLDMQTLQFVQQIRGSFRISHPNFLSLRDGYCNGVTGLDH